eukprot:6199394-Pleurochrysis_carterae.AAC.2
MPLLHDHVDIAVAPTHTCKYMHSRHTITTRARARSVSGSQEHAAAHTHNQTHMHACWLAFLISLRTLAHPGTHLLALSAIMPLAHRSLHH